MYTYIYIYIYIHILISSAAGSRQAWTRTICLATNVLFSKCLATIEAMIHPGILL